MRYILLICMLKLTCAWGQISEICEDEQSYNKAIRKANAMIRSGDYGSAYDQYKAAKIYCTAKGQETQAKQDELFERVSGLLEKIEKKAESDRIHNLVLTKKATPIQSLRLLEEAMVLDPSDQAIKASYQNLLNSDEAFTVPGTPAPASKSYGQDSSEAYEVNFAIYSPNGEYIFTIPKNRNYRTYRDSRIQPYSSNDENKHTAARIWKYTGEKVCDLPGNSFLMDKAIFAHEKRIILAYGKSYREAFIYDADGKLINSLDHKDRISAIQISPDDQFFLTGGLFDGEVKLWDASFQNMQTFPVNPLGGSVNAIACSHNNDRIAASGKYNSISIWDFSGKRLNEFSGHQNKINSIAFSPDDQLIATASDDRTAKLWSLNGQLKHTLYGHAYPIQSASFSPDGKYVLTQDRHIALLWSIDGLLLWRYKRDESLVFAGFHPKKDSLHFIYVRNDEFISVHEAFPQKLYPSLEYSDKTRFGLIKSAIPLSPEPSGYNAFVIIKTVQPRPLNLDEVRAKIRSSVPARFMKKAGQVDLRVSVDEYGGYTNHYIMTKEIHPKLKAAIVEHIPTLLFNPATSDGTAISDQVQIRFDFQEKGN